MRPRVLVVGRIDHADFREAMALLGATAELVSSVESRPELTIVTQSRPGEFSARQVDLLRRGAPLSGIVALLGSWCEGETRTGRPWPGVLRVYWHEFPAWWRQQMALRASGRCPEWTRPADCGLRISDCGLDDQLIRKPKSAICNRFGGVIVLGTQHSSTADSLSDAVSQAGYATVWRRLGRPSTIVRGAVAGIWDGGQLDDDEEQQLAAFSRHLARDGAPVIALLDFPRHDRVERALAAGAAGVLGKPWSNVELVSTMSFLIAEGARLRETCAPRAA
jgi:hypothetical protein